MQKYSLNFKNFPSTSQTIDLDGLYWINVGKMRDALALLLSVSMDGEPILFFTEKDCREELCGLGRDAAVARANVEVVSIRGNCHALEEVSHALHFMAGCRDRLVVALLDAEGISALSGPLLQETLLRFYQHVNRHHCAVLVLCTGETCSRTRYELRQNQKLFRGISALECYGGFYRYDVIFWRTRLTIKGSSSTHLLADGEVFRADSRSTGEFVASDASEIYTSISLYGADHELAPMQRLFACNREVIEATAEAVSATVVLTLNAYSEMREVAQMVHDLRIRRGQRLKIAVIEQGMSLRAISEALLLECGANTVLRSQSGIGYLQVMVANLRRQIYTHDVPPDFEAIYRELLLSDKVGYLKFPDFAQCVTEIASGSHARGRGHGALVVLTPLDGIDAAETMMQFAPKRSGDVGTVAGSVAVIYLYGCQESVLGDVLRYVFPVALHTLFREYSVVISDDAVRELIAKMWQSSDWIRSGAVSEHRHSMLEFAHQRAKMISPDADRKKLTELVTRNPVVPHPAADNVPGGKEFLK